MLGYTIYAVDIPLLSGDFINASNRGFTDRSFDAFVRDSELHQSLRIISEKTGGRALLNAKSTNVLAEVADDTRSYYWIGFTPSREWDDTRHRVEVKVADGALRTRTRSGYLDSSRKHEAVMAVESALLFGNPASEAAVKVAVGAMRRSGRRLMDVPITVFIPLDEVSVVPVGDEYVVDLELHIAVRDADGRRAEVPAVPVRLRLRKTPVAGAVARYETRLRLRRQVHSGVVAIHDLVSGRIFSTKLQLAP